MARKRSRANADAEFRALLDRCLEEHRLKTEAHAAGWEQ
jgi:hypothetical protein